MVLILAKRDQDQANFHRNFLVQTKASRLDCINVVFHQAGVIAATIVDGVSIVRRLPTAQSITPLPEQICGNGADSRCLPGSLGAAKTQ